MRNTLGNVLGAPSLQRVRQGYPHFEHIELRENFRGHHSTFAIRLLDDALRRVQAPGYQMGPTAVTEKGRKRQEAERRALEKLGGRR